MPASDVSNIKSGQAYGVRHFNASRPGTLADVVAMATDLAVSKAGELIWLGSVYCNDLRANENTSVQVGDYLRVHTQPRRYSVDLIRYPEVIVFKNDQFMVIDKPAGLPVHATVDNARENLVHELSLKTSSAIYVTHRLDNATSGLMVLALTESFQKKFNLMLRSGEVKKTYRAVVHGVGVAGKFDSSKWVHYMEQSPRAPKKITREPTMLNSQKCVLNILSTKEISLTETEVWLELETGRTHQIRAQLSCEGHPILGDGMYGAPTLNVSEVIALQSARLSFGEFEFKI